MFVKVKNWGAKPNIMQQYVNFKKPNNKKILEGNLEKNTRNDK